MSAAPPLPSNIDDIYDDYRPTGVTPGDWAQIVIAACGLLVVVIALCIKYRTGIKTWIVGWWENVCPVTLCRAAFQFLSSIQILTL
jgi:hypothetical protein